MNDHDFSGLRALLLNCSLEARGEDSHTRRLLERVAGVITENGAQAEIVHAREHTIAVGMVRDATEHGAAADDWPDLQRRILDADILVLGTPIWLGVPSSVATLVVERLYAYSGDHNDRGQYAYYGRTAGCAVTGNEDGIKACARDLLYALQHIGYTIPPQADCGWIGEAGPGPSYGDVVDGSSEPVGYGNDFTNRNTTIMAHNLLHMAAMLRERGGFPAFGNRADRGDDAPRAEDTVPEPVRRRS